MDIDHLKTRTIANSCQEIIDAVRSSLLNFSFQETPFSIYLTVRKSLNKCANQELSFKQQREAFSYVKSEQETIQSKIEILENANEMLKQNYEEALIEAETFANQKYDLETKLEILSEKLDVSEKRIETEVAKKVQSISVEKRALQLKHEKIVAEFKDLKNENEDLKKETNSLGIALKSSKKELKQITGSHIKKVEVLEMKLIDLQNFKMDKTSEEKELKRKLKSVNKKLKSLTEREAKVKLELERNVDENKNLKAVDEKKLGETFACKHSPQCLSREPSSPPIGPLTIAQFELQEIVLKNEKIEKIETFVGIVKDFFRLEPTADIDITIAKLEAVRGLFEVDSHQTKMETNEFDQILDMAKETKVFIEHLKKEQYENSDEDDYIDEDDLPRHYLGEEGEFVFKDS